MKTITIDVPEAALASFRQAPEEFAREMRLAAAVKWYEMGSISQEKAAQIAGLSRSRFIEELARFGVDFMQYREDELRDEVSDGE